MKVDKLAAAATAALVYCASVAAEQPPHIVFILVDDLGYNDFAYQSSDLKDIAWTNVNKLVPDALKLEKYYTQPICTPTRGAFMSGRYPARLGLQHGVIAGFQDYGLPLDEVTLATKLKRAGYNTYAVGKWHLGLYSFNATPTHRGFDQYVGYWNGAEDYLTHEIQNYLDFHRQNGTAYEQISDESGRYSTPFFTQEMESMIDAHPKGKPGFFLFSPAKCACPAGEPRRQVRRAVQEH